MIVPIRTAMVRGGAPRGPEGAGVCFYDIELAKPVESVGGWGNAIRGHAGLACAVVLGLDGACRMFDAQSVSDLVAWLNKYAWAVGFNNIGFDNKVIHAITTARITCNLFDLHQAVRERVGRFGRGWRLADISGGMLESQHPCVAKLGEGADVPERFSRGHIAQAYEHCLQDVRMLAEIVRRIVVGGCRVSNGVSTIGICLPPELSAILTRHYAAAVADQQGNTSGGKSIESNV